MLMTRSNQRSQISTKNGGNYGHLQSLSQCRINKNAQLPEMPP